MAIWNYTIGYNRIKRGYLSGFTLSEDGVIRMSQGTSHVLILPAIDSHKQGSFWGRLSMKVQLPQTAILTIRAFAVDPVSEDEAEEQYRMNDFFQNPDIPMEVKYKLFEQSDGMIKMQSEDLLLYDLQGRFLWMCVEVSGEGEGWIRDIFLSNPGDNFMQTFPEIYQDPGGFFHRYMSVFSSMYREVDDEIHKVDQYLDIDQAPEPFLHMYASWQGLEVEGEFLDEKILRKLLKEIYVLNSMKGTKQAIQKLIKIVLSQESIIVERNLMDGYITMDEKKIYNELYGDNVQDVTILINHKPMEKLQAQLLYLIGQFKPVRCNIHLVFYGDCNRLDSYCFIDRNAVLQQMSENYVDGAGMMDGSVVLA